MTSPDASRAAREQEIEQRLETAMDQDALASYMQVVADARYLLRQVQELQAKLEITEGDYEAMYETAVKLLSGAEAAEARVAALEAALHDARNALAYHQAHPNVSVGADIAAIDVALATPPEAEHG